MPRTVTELFRVGREVQGADDRLGNNRVAVGEWNTDQGLILRALQVR